MLNGSYLWITQNNQLDHNSIHITKEQTDLCGKAMHDHGPRHSPNIHIPYSFQLAHMF